MRTLVAAGLVALGLVAMPASAHAKTPWIVTVTSTTTQAVAGHKIVFTGVVHPKGAAAGGTVVLQEKFAPGKPWKAQKSVKIDKHGAYRVTDRPTANTKHAYRVVMPATSAHARGVSRTLTFKVYGWDDLFDLPAVNQNGVYEGDVDINGTSYAHSLYAEWSPAYIEYNLDHGCIKLRGTFGISDDSTTGGQAEVDVIADGSQIYTHTFDLGQSQPKSLTLARPLKLRLEAHSTSPAGTIGYGAFATPSVLCTR